jgi:hypothetical protein
MLNFFSDFFQIENCLTEKYTNSPVTMDHDEDVGFASEKERKLEA